MRKKTRIARAVQNILTPEQYARTKHDTPYLYTLGAGDQALTFVGARHTQDANDQLCNLIPEVFAELAPDVVLVEGLQSIAGVAGTEQLIRSLSPAEAMARGGEGVFTITQALARKVPWLCPEPRDASLMRHLALEWYSHEQLVAWYVLRLLGQYHLRTEPIPFSAYVAPFLTHLRAATNWPNVTYTLEAAVATATTALGHTPNLHNAERAREYTDPIPWPTRWEQQTMFNDITRTALAFRDRHIVQRTADELLAGKRVMVVYGAGHAVMQEPAYRYLMTNQ